jgi:hypothetical protein
MALRQGQPPYVCFYSNKCDWSSAFLKELSQTPYKHDFQYVCVEKTPRSQLPDWLKQVPTLLIRDDEEPIKTDGEVMNWLFLRKMRDGGGGGGGGQRGPGGQGGGPSPAGGGEPEAWNMSEMGGKLSESYGVILDGNSATVDSSATKNFDMTWLGGNAAVGDRTIQGIGDSIRQEPSRAKSKKEELMDRQMAAYMSARDQGMPPVRPRISSAGPGPAPPQNSFNMR